MRTTSLPGTEATVQVMGPCALQPEPKQGKPETVVLPKDILEGGNQQIQAERKQCRQGALEDSKQTQFQINPLRITARYCKLTLPREIKAGSVGEQPCQGIARQGSSSRRWAEGQDAQLMSRPSPSPIGLIALLCLKKRKRRRTATTDCSRLRKSAGVQFPLNRHSSRRDQ